MSLIDNLKRKTEAFEIENGITPMVGMYFAVSKNKDGKLANYVISGQRDGVDDPKQYWYQFGRSIAHISDDENVQALMFGIIDATDAPIQKAIKGGAK